MGATPSHEGIPKPDKIERPARKKTKAKPKRKKKRGKSSAKSNGRRSATRRNIGRLVIVESPAKARSIGGFLGDGYTVMSSVGHVRDLLKSRLSVDIENNFEPEYRVPNDKREVVKELKAAAEGAEEIFLATDPDREGEAIAWHLVAAAEMPPSNVRRVVFHEITDNAVAEAFAHPRQINVDLVNAQQARRILDRLVGYQVSQLLWSKVRSGLSAGRVQSIALRLVVEREKEIEAFKPVEYWTVDAELSKREATPPPPFSARLVRIHDERVTFDPKGSAPPFLDCEATVKPHLDALNRSAFVVDSVKRGTRQSKPSAPFTTSTLQQAASSSASRTMRIAQQLYEGIDLGNGSPVGLITYMRTDSVQVSKDAQAEARQYVQAKHGSSYLPKTSPRYKTRSRTAQEAHEAIRPTSVMRTPQSLANYLNRSQLQLYTLIWNRFVASQMAPAIYDTLSIEIKAGLTNSDMPYRFRASGSKLKFPGHLILNAKRENGAGGALRDFPDLAPGEVLDRRKIIPEQHFTQPPPRYTEANLIRQLEERGIGRPSTYAPTVTVIQTREYVTQEDRRLKPTKTGIVVCELLTEYFTEEMDYAFTAKMEDQLDEVSRGALDWRPMLDEFYHPFERRLENARENMPRRNVIEKVGRDCPKCGDGELVIKHSRYGKFIGCSNYPECKHTERFLERKGYLCPQCGDEHRGEIVERRSRKGRAFFGCDRYPDCDFTTWRLPRNLERVAPQPTGETDKVPSTI
ncbi:MAG: type I DNA topoisomerase [Chloroflexi bacterium]|nr:type I DNA topoisomerase [Chloroflexota bacterium]